MVTRRLLAGLILALLALHAVPASAAVLGAEVDRAVVGLDETFTLVLSLPTQNPAAGPDLTPLQADFEVLGSRQSSQVRIVNGSVDASTRWLVSLTPRRTGELTIPALRAGDAVSAALTIRVERGTPASAAQGAPVFMETALELDRQYVQGELIYRVRIHYARPLREASLSEPRAEGAVIERLGEDRQYEVQREGRRYQVIERRYALFPQRSGPLTITAPVLDARVDEPRRGGSGLGQRFADRLGLDPFDALRGGRPLRVRGEDVTAEVRPRPAGAADGAWLPARAVTLSEEWSGDGGPWRVGEPVTRTVTVAAAGLTGAQLPDLELAPPGADLKAYPDQAQHRTEAGAAGVVGNRTLKAALVPTRPGRIELPPLTLHWWDTEADRPRTATLPGRSVQVLPAAQAEPPPPVPPPTPAAVPAAEPRPASAREVALEPGVWPWVSALLAAGWLLTGVLWLRERRRPADSEDGEPGTATAADPKRARKAVARACNAGDDAAVRDALLAWAATRWPDAPPRTLPALARRVHAPDGREAVLALDDSLYGPTPRPWERPRYRGRLLSTLDEEPPAGRAEASPLPPLYPGATVSGSKYGS